MRSVELSFLITNFNGEAHLKETLPRLVEVVGEEKFRADCELVVTDARSTDGSVDFLRRFAARYPNVRIVEEDCTRGRGREIAFEQSVGSRVAVVDSDTYVRPIYGNFIRGYLAHAMSSEQALVAYEDMDGRRANLTCSFYPRQLLTDVGGWRDLAGAEDIDLWVRLILRDRLRFLPVCLADDVEHANAPPISSPANYRTLREKRYARGVGFLRRWVRQTSGRYVAFGYSLPEKIREDWRNQPRWSNRLLDLVGSAIARIHFYYRHPSVYRISRDRTNGVELHRYLCSHIVSPSTFGLDDALLELRVNREIRDSVRRNDLPESFVTLYRELDARGRVLDTGT